jgi:raffinose/stachyose/melibiose transport system permease protein
MNNKPIIKKTIIRLIILLLVIIETYPLVWMLTASLKKPA